MFINREKQYSEKENSEEYEKVTKQRAHERDIRKQKTTRNALKAAGDDEYEFISLGENAENVCGTCDDLDGQRFKIADAVVGVNCPPMHPFCRCKVTTPQQSEEDIQREIDERIDS